MAFERMSDDRETALRENLMWMKISSDFNWTEELLVKYADHVDWPAISANEHVYWTESLIQRFTFNLDWTALSRNTARILSDPQLVRPFAMFWCWRYKTTTTAWTPDFIKEMRKFLDWEQLLQLLPYERQDELISQFADVISPVPPSRPQREKNDEDDSSSWFRRRRIKHDRQEDEVIVLAE